MGTGNLRALYLQIGSTLDFKMHETVPTWSRKEGLKCLRA